MHKIGWLNIPGYTPETWNPIVGCSKISAGCANCYAERIASRMCAIGVEQYQHVMGPANGYNSAGVWIGKTRLVEYALQKLLGWKKPRAVFVNSMGDLFHENTPPDEIGKVFDVIKMRPQHLFIVLTKRASRMEQFMQSYFRLPAKNVWLGVTAENQAAADERIPHLLRTPAAVRFVSVEPMIGPVVLNDDWLERTCVECGSADFGKPRNGPAQCWEPCGIAEMPCGCTQSTGIDWIICGGESGPRARPMLPKWARSLRDQAQDAGVPFFFKQWGDPRPYFGEQLDAGFTCSRANGGDSLDGRQWHEWPQGRKEG